MLSLSQVRLRFGKGVGVSRAASAGSNSHVPAKKARETSGQWGIARYNKDMRKWSLQECEEWLWDVCKVYPQNLIQPILSEFKIKNGADLAELTFDKLLLSAKRSEKLKNLRPFHARIIGAEIMSRKELPFERYVIQSKPYTWPYNGIMHPGNTAVIVVDMQNDFCNPNFPQAYIKSVNPSCDFADVKAITPNIQSLLGTMRKLGYRIIHTRESHLPLSADLPANKHWRSCAEGIPGLGDIHDNLKPNIRPLTHGTYGWEIIDELKPADNEPVIDKPTKGAFANTNIDLVLKTLGVQNLIMTGVTTDVCVHTIMREANDRGFECILATDATCSVNQRVWAAAIESVHLSGGIFGCTATVKDIEQAMNWDPRNKKE